MENIDVNNIWVEVRDLFEEYMDELDWEKIHKIMEILDWKWADGAGNMNIPSLGEMRKVVRSLLKQSLQESIRNNGENHYVSTGGFEVFVGFDMEEKEGYTKDNVYFDIRFILESIGNY